MVEWSKAAVCKTVFRGFKSHSVLKQIMGRKSVDTGELTPMEISGYTVGEVGRKSLGRFL